jgi:hypothetical protein
MRGRNMLTRRALLATGTTVLLLVPILGCSSSSSTADGATCNGVDSTSTVNSAHTHSVCVPTTDLTNPPAAGATYTTTNVSQHIHTIMLTQAELTAINAGTATPVTSSSDVDPINNLAHTHDFTITKA